ncbi:MAG: DUF3426 domain-containing protein [Sulfuricella sp.]|nr:DUF3426 domain-containing protein [Sulfuricella sp.]
MAMLTTCPACHTRFRVTSEQLEAHHGDVRCGRCAKVFNAHAYLEQEPEAPAPETAAPFPAEEIETIEILPPPEPEPEPETEDFLFEILPDFPPPREEPAEPPPAETEIGEIGPVEAEIVAEEPVEETFPPLEAAAETAEPEPAVMEEKGALPAQPEPTVAEEETPSEEETAAKHGFGWLWLIGSVLLLLGLAGQGLYFFRTEVASRYPEIKPLLQQACGVLQCTIRLPANPDLLSIETSNLEADPQQASQVTLNAILRNRAKIAQEYPNLELTLTDTQDKMIARRIFLPKEYAKNADLGRGMPPNEEAQVKLRLDLGDLKAAGYRVFLFYPQ